MCVGLNVCRSHADHQCEDLTVFKVSEQETMNEYGVSLSFKVHVKCKQVVTAET